MTQLEKYLLATEDVEVLRLARAAAARESNHTCAPDCEHLPLEHDAFDLGAVHKRDGLVAANPFRHELLREAYDRGYAIPC